MTPEERRLLAYRLAITAVVYDMLLTRLGVKVLSQNRLVLAQL
jgi:hypothetical protein